MADQIIRRPQLLDELGFCKSTLYALIGAGRFPRPVPLGPRAVGWLRSEIEAWRAARIAERDAHRSPAA